MADQPLSPATDRRLGRPLPHQLPNQTRVHPSAINLWYFDHAVKIHYAVLPFVSKRYPPLKGRLLTRYSPVRHSVISYFIRRIRNQASFDLHVLSTPPAFVLSQDQTLKTIVLTHSCECTNQILKSELLSFQTLTFKITVFVSLDTQY